MEERVERLENLVTLQERTIEKLSDAVFEQHQQIATLEKMVERLAGKLRDIDAALDDSGIADVPPPHYNG
ncbi:SlyX family protein [Pseudodesulfovibrio piezophilus]|uniref:SlyX family protein n=1 Tax=Pseudodesulfovibrio piezophilus (strain DSM 21447 / JCM 15486 / C1TLV30) TaxID=1322246 RepID=M1WXB5_PSEP2|nr:SlyX family protein [Pseudodesulfovibrio piezophilus]CCH49638.1 SlyX family protein [Pseudodesulfovibrio piezophilus C1TLV30]